MTHGIEWRYGTKISEQGVRGIEAAVGVSFPVSYRALVLEHDGGVAAAGRISFDDPLVPGRKDFIGLGQLLRIVPVDDETSLMEAFEQVKDLGPGLVPFAVEGGGWKIAFDFRSAPNEPGVVLIISDTDDIVELAPNFDAYLNAAATNIDEGCDPKPF